MTGERTEQVSPARCPIVAYTDGGCRGNPGVGGWGFLLVDTRTGRALERQGGLAHTTNNRMELTAAMEALGSLRGEGQRVEIRTDSRYMVDLATRWVVTWKERGWKRKGSQEVANLDLVQELDRLQQRHLVRWTWVPAHSGEPGNEYVDGLANSAMDQITAGRTESSERRWERSPVSIPPAPQDAEERLP